MSTTSPRRIFVSRQFANSVKYLTQSAKRHSYLIYKIVIASGLVIVNNIYGVYFINPDTAAKMYFHQFYRKEFKILLDVFTSYTVNSRLQRMVTSLRTF